jgi:hypothetical protein
MPLITEEDGIISASPTAYVPEAVPTISVVAPTYRDVVVDTSNTPINTLMTAISGYPWTVQYYSQLVDTDTPLQQQTLSLDIPYQQYRRIDGLEIRVTSPLTTQQDEVTKTMTTGGSATVYAGVVPNTNDPFIADIGTGKPTVFRVTKSEQKTFLAKTAYEISYVVMSDHQEYLDDLARKTISSYVFKKDQIAYGQSPLVVTSDADLIDQIGITLDRLIDFYLKTFYDLDFGTIMIPMQGQPCYDPTLVDFLTKTLRVSDHPSVVRVREINFDDDRVYRQSNFWTAIRERDGGELLYGFTRTTMVEASQFVSNPYSYGVRWTGISYVTYPIDPKVGVGGLLAANVKVPISAFTVMDAGVGATFYPRQNDAVSANNVPTPVQPVSIGSVLDDDYYVLSQNFYLKNSDMNVLEQEVWNYLDGRALDGSQLLNSAKLAMSWGSIEQLYYIPLMIVLMRAYLRSYQVW